MVQLNEKSGIVEFVKRNNTHQTHFEDLVLLGKEGLDELNDKIDKFLQSRLGNDVGLNTTTKIDGSPAVICWSKFEGYPDNSIALKSFIGSAKTAISSIDDIDAKYGDRPEMAEKLRYCLQLASYIPEGEAWQGDCLFTQMDLREQNIKGINYLTFHPNKIVYAFSEDNPGYEQVKDAEFGIAFHTIYKDAGNGAKNQSFRVDASRLNAPSQFYIMSPALDTSKLTFDMEKLENQYNSLKNLENALTATSDYEELVHNEAFMEYWNTFENANLADKKAVNIDLETFFNDLWDYIEEKQTKEFSKKFQNLKTVKGKMGAIDKWAEGVAELHDILNRNKNVIVLMVNALNTAANIKMEMWEGFKAANTGVDTFYRSRTKGFFPANMEGIAMSDAEGNIVKIVDRSEFSSANRDADIMAGWEHPENSNKVIESIDKYEATIPVSRFLEELDPSVRQEFFYFMKNHGNHFGVVDFDSIVSLMDIYNDWKGYLESKISSHEVTNEDEAMDNGCEIGDIAYSAESEEFGEIAFAYPTSVGGDYTVWVLEDNDDYQFTVAADLIKPNKVVRAMMDCLDRKFYSGKDLETLTGAENIIEESSKKLDEEKLWNTFSELLESDESQKTVVIGWGRMNPPTVGHLKLVNKMKELALDTQCPARLYLSHSVDKKNECKNPLPYESKIKWATLAFGELVDVVNTDSKTIMTVLHDLYAEGFKHIIYVGGEDRIGGDGDITELISKYNGYPAKENMFYKFDSIVFENAGHRDENSDDITEKASASYARQLAIEGDFETFKLVEPLTPDLAAQLFKELRTAMHVQESSRKQIIKNLNKIFEEAERLNEATFKGGDFEKHTYLADVIKNFRGDGVITKDGQVFKMPDRYVGKEDAWAEELMGVKDIALDGGKSKYVSRRNKFKELTDIDWYDIDKSNYSGVGSKGSRSIKSFNVTAMQEAIQALILTEKILPDEITLENLQNLLQLPSSTKEEDFDIFMDVWKDAFDNAYNGVATFQKALTDLGFDDLSKLIVLHNYVKNDYTGLSETIFNDYGAATIDKADFYLWNGVGGENFLPDLIAKRKNNEGFVDAMVDLVTNGILVGVSLKKVEGALHAEWDPIVPDDYITGEVTWNLAVNKKDAGTVTNYLNFKTKDGYLVLCVRPNGEGSARTEFRFGSKPNSLSGIAYGSATKPITALFGDNFSTLMNSKTSATPCQDASEYLLGKLGVKNPVENSTMTLSKAGIVAISNLFAEAAGYGAKNEDGSRKTAPYIKVY